MSGQTGFSPDADIPNLKGKVFFVTGGTAGIGKQTILALAKHNPAHIHFTGRNAKNAESLIEEVSTIAPGVRVTFGECDQGFLESVNEAATSFIKSQPHRLDVLICNAGIVAASPGLTRDGYEIQFGVNFLAHALLTKRLLPLLEQTAKDEGEARIINLTSDGYKFHPGDVPFQDLKTTQEDIGFAGKWARYGQSKFANVIYTAELAKRYPTIISVAIHPGVVPGTAILEDLPLFDKIFVKLTTIGKTLGLEEGAYNTLWAATTFNKRDLQSGGLFYPVGVPMAYTKAASDQARWKELWEWTERELDIYRDHINPRTRV